MVIQINIFVNHVDVKLNSTLKRCEVWYGVRLQNTWHAVRYLVDVTTDKNATFATLPFGLEVKYEVVSEATIHFIASSWGT